MKRFNWCLSLWLPLLLIIVFSGVLACGPPPPPDPPMNIRTDVDQNIDGKIIITWELKLELGTRIDKFLIHRDRDRSGKFDDKIKEIKQSGFEEEDKNAKIFKYKLLDINVIVGNQYEIPFFYRITSVDIDGQVGNPSEIIEARTKNFDRPTIVDGVQVNGTNFDSGPQIIVSWQANKEYDIDGYYVFRGERDEPISTTNPTDAVSKQLIEHIPNKRLSWVDTTIQAGKQYWYSVVAVDKGNLIGDSRPGVRYSGLALAQVELLTPDDGSGVTRPTFSWKPVNSAVGYVLILQTSQRGGVIWRTDLLKTTEITYAGSQILTTGLTYYWYVFAYAQNPKDPKTEDGNSSSEVWKFTVK